MSFQRVRRATPVSFFPAVYRPHRIADFVPRDAACAKIADHAFDSEDAAALAR